MKVVFEEAATDEAEVIVRCRSRENAEVERIMSALIAIERKLLARSDDGTVVLSPNDVLYAESVDDRLYVCTGKEVLSVHGTLAQLESDFGDRGFFRCSKSLIINLMKIDALRSETSGRILVTLQNGERLLVSRRYAASLREKIKSGV